LLGETAGRLAGGLILAVILISSTVTASRSRTHHVIGAVLAFFAFGLQVGGLETHSTTVEAIDAAIFAIFFLYTALLIFRHVLSFGPVYADRVHAALSVYILLAPAFKRLPFCRPSRNADGPIDRANASGPARPYSFVETASAMTVGAKIGAFNSAFGAGTLRRV
jgi:hypothetical protein